MARVIQGVSPLAGLINRYFRSQNLSERIESYRALRHWRPAVGEQIASHTRPIRVRQGAIDVLVDTPVWMQQLQLLKPHILKKLNEFQQGYKFTNLYLKVGKIEAPSPPSTPKPEPPRPTTEDWDYARALCTSMTEPEARRTMEHFIAHHRAWKRSLDEADAPPEK